MGRATRKVTLVVTTQRGSNAEARKVLQDVDELRRWDEARLSVGVVSVEVRR